MTRISSINVLTAITPGHELALDTCLRSVSREVFTNVEPAHFARWVILGQTALFRPRTRQRMKYLLFSAAFDGRQDAFVEAVRVGLAQRADDVWGHCVGYPSWRSPEAFHDWIAHNALPVRARFAAWPQLSPAQVGAALELRARHIDFAVANQSVDDDELQQRFLAEFGP